MISIVIATWNRRDILNFVLGKLRGQTCKDFEIIVVDNGSSDGTETMIKDGFKEVRLIRLLENIGTEAYNFGVETSKGEYLVLLDNDCFLKEDALEKIVERFSQESSIAAIALHIKIHGTDISETEGWQEDTPNFLGTAVAMRKEAFSRVGGYERDYFIMHTDLELATRILNYNYRLVYDDKIIGYHLRAAQARLKDDSIYYAVRNAVFYYWKYFPAFYALRLTAREIIYGFSFALKRRCLCAYIKGIFSAAFHLPKILGSRSPLKPEIYLRLRKYLDSQFREPLFRKAISKLFKEGRAKVKQREFMKSDKEAWDGIWQGVDIDIHEDRFFVQKELSSLRWKKIEKELLKSRHSFSGLEVIEVGAGRGEYALLMALQGAKVTLLDYSEVALQKARSLFSNFNCSARFIQADALNLPPDLLNGFDISMSFGLAEHFTFPGRREIVKAHLKLLKPGGLSFISVPNTLCFPYRISRIFLKLLGKLKISEYPFTPQELRGIASSIGYRSIKVKGSSFFGSLEEFLFRNAVNFIAKRVGSKKFLKAYSRIIIKEIPTPLDDYLGYSLILMGNKQGN